MVSEMRAVIGAFLAIIAMATLIGPVDRRHPGQSPTRRARRAGPPSPSECRDRRQASTISDASGGYLAPSLRRLVISRRRRT